MRGGGGVRQRELERVNSVAAKVIKWDNRFMSERLRGRSKSKIERKKERKNERERDVKS